MTTTQRVLALGRVISDTSAGRPVAARAIFGRPGYEAKKVVGGEKLLYRESESLEGGPDLGSPQENELQYIVGLDIFGKRLYCHRPFPLGESGDVTVILTFRCPSTM